jgi:hypothetical protein
MTQPSPTAPEPGAEIVCPFCAAAETELFSMFGQFLLASQYYCRGCKTVFDVVRSEDRIRTAQAQEGKTHLSGVRSSNGASTGGEAG